jgi:hypothetical protein
MPVITIRPSSRTPRRTSPSVGARAPTAVAQRAGTAQPVQGPARVRGGRRGRLLRPRGAHEQLVERLAETRFSPSSDRAAAASRPVVRAGARPALRRGALRGSDAGDREIFPGAYPLEELEAALLGRRNAAASLLEQLERGRARAARASKRVLPAEGSELVLVLDTARGDLHARGGRGAARPVPRDARARGARPAQPACASCHAARRLLRPAAALQRVRGAAARLCRGARAADARRVRAGDRRARRASRRDARVGAALGAGRRRSERARRALPLLQYALTELYERREGAVLTRDAYRRSDASQARSPAGRGDLRSAPGGGPGCGRQLISPPCDAGRGGGGHAPPRRSHRARAMEVDQASIVQAIDASERPACSRSTATRARHADGRGGPRGAAARVGAPAPHGSTRAREDVRLHRRLVRGRAGVDASGGTRASSSAAVSWRSSTRSRTSRGSR